MIDPLDYFSVAPAPTRDPCKVQHAPKGPAWTRVGDMPPYAQAVAKEAERRRRSPKYDPHTLEPLGEPTNVAAGDPGPDVPRSERMFALFEAGWSQRDIARYFEVAQGAVSQAVTRVRAYRLRQPTRP